MGAILKLDCSACGVSGHQASLFWADRGEAERHDQAGWLMKMLPAAISNHVQVDIKTSRLTFFHPPFCRGRSECLRFRFLVRVGRCSTPLVPSPTMLTMSQLPVYRVPMLVPPNIQYERRRSRWAGSGVSAVDHTRCAVDRQAGRSNTVLIRPL